MLRLYILLLFIFSLSCSSLSKDSRVELKRKSHIDMSFPLEISGLVKYKDKILVVSDNNTDTFIYEVLQDGSYKEFINLRKLKGFQDYYKRVQGKKYLDFDLEDLSVCGDEFFIANERHWNIIHIQENIMKGIFPKWRKEDLEILNQGGENTGIEGLAVDCQNKKVYLAKERDPRRIFKIDFEGNILESFDFPLSDRQGAKVINPFNGEGLFVTSPDISSMVYSDGYLYVLERNTFEISKYDLSQKKVIKRYSYFENKGYYFTEKPFGFAEALYIDKKNIYLGIDNNGAKRSPKFLDILKGKLNQNSLILIFDH